MDDEEEKLFNQIDMSFKNNNKKHLLYDTNKNICLTDIT